MLKGGLARSDKHQNYAKAKRQASAWTFGRTFCLYRKVKMALCPVCANGINVMRSVQVPTAKRMLSRNVIWSGECIQKWQLGDCGFVSALYLWSAFMDMNMNMYMYSAHGGDSIEKYYRDIIVSLTHKIECISEADDEVFYAWWHFFLWFNLSMYDRVSKDNKCQLPNWMSIIVYIYKGMADETER